MLSKLSTFFKVHPMLKGMCSYAIIWPTSSIIQQKITSEPVDLKKAFRFFLFGTFFVAPTLYGWVKLTSAMWPKMNFRTGITKAIIEQGSYGPMAGVSFFGMMSLMEGKSFGESVNEVKTKFPDTFKVGICFWPIAQTINFSFVKEKNRVLYVSILSFVWTIFLAYMKQLKADELHEIENHLTKEHLLEDIHKLQTNLHQNPTKN